MIRSLSIAPNSILYHELVCAALTGISANPNFSSHSTRERAQQALDMATHALDGVVEVDGGERDFKREKKDRKPFEKHQAPGRPALLDELRPHLDGFLGTWGMGEVLSLRQAAQKFREFTSLIGIGITDRVAVDMIRQMATEAKLTLKETEPGKLQVSL